MIWTIIKLMSIVLFAYALGLGFDVLCNEEEVKDEGRTLIKKRDKVFHGVYFWRIASLFVASLVIASISIISTYDRIEELEKDKLDLYYENMNLRAQDDPEFSGVYLEDTIDLEPCPFCGSTNIKLVYEAGGALSRSWTLDCQGSDEHGWDDCQISVSGSSVSDVIEKWNTRY